MPRNSKCVETGLCVWDLDWTYSDYSHSFRAVDVFIPEPNGFGDKVIYQRKSNSIVFEFRSMNVSLDWYSRARVVGGLFWI